MEKGWLVVLLGVVCWCAGAAGVELTFELPDNAKECFYEEIEKGTASSLEFQVGGAERVELGKLCVHVLVLQFSAYWRS